MKLKTLIVGLSVIPFSYVSVFAQSVIIDRNMLNSLLGASRVDETFENGPVIGSGAVGGPGLLSSTNDWNENGTGYNLIVPGITLKSTDPVASSIRWNGTDFSGIGTKTVSGNSGLYLDFWNYTSAFGIDFKDYPVNRSVLGAGITVYGADDTTVIYQDLLFPLSDPVATFFGYQYGGGIGAVFFTVTQPGPFYEDKSPTIDNLSFSTAPIPEPSTYCLGLLALGFGIYRFRRT